VIGIDTCEERLASSCNPFTDPVATAVLAEWTVASVEVSRPAAGTKVVTSSAAIADAGVAMASPQK
jgi:hypothetical protein